MKKLKIYINSYQTFCLYEIDHAIKTAIERFFFLINVSHRLIIKIPAAGDRKAKYKKNA